jgi:hypothetical protein
VTEIWPDDPVRTLAEMQARARVPHSTVYMDNSHHPRPSEERAAREFHRAYIQPLLDRIAQLEDEVERLAGLLREVANCGVSQVAQPPGLDWYEIQVDLPTWDALAPYRSPATTSTPASITPSEALDPHDGPESA